MTQERLWYMSSNPKFHLLGPDGKTLCGKTLKFTSVTRRESQIGYRLNRSTFCRTCKSNGDKNGSV